MNREEFLNKAKDRLQSDVFGLAGLTIPEDVQLTCGWPSTGGASAKRKTVGQCWARSSSDALENQVFISPTIADTVQVLGVLAHELIHAIDDCRNGHKSPFRKMALAIGLTGKMTATEIGEELLPKLEKIREDLGEYPHAPMKAPAPKQKNRQLKLQCKDCNAVWRMARAWFSQVTACPCCQQSNIEGV